MFHTTLTNAFMSTYRPKKTVPAVSANEDNSFRITFVSRNMISRRFL